jgi:hypothetical protein
MGYPNGRTPGEEWKTVYQDAQRKATFFFFVITQSWADSPYCQQEMEWFLNIRRQRDEKREESHVILFTVGWGKPTLFIHVQSQVGSQRQSLILLSSTQKIAKRKQKKKKNVCQNSIHSLTPSSTTIFFSLLTSLLFRLFGKP